MPYFACGTPLLGRYRPPVFEAITALPGPPEWRQGPEVQAQPAHGTADEERKVPISEDFHTETHVAEVTADGEAPHPRWQSELGTAMGDHHGRLCWAMIEQIEVGAIGSNSLQRWCHSLRFSEIMMCLKTGEGGQPVEAEIDEEQAMQM